MPNLPPRPHAHVSARAPARARPDLAGSTLATLQALISLADDEAAHFASAAALARHEEVRALLLRRARDCQAQAAELVAQLGPVGAASPAHPAPAHGWDAPEALLRATLPSHADQALLEACERLEDAVLERYSQALEQPLEAGARLVLQAQRRQKHRQHELLRALRDHLRSPPETRPEPQVLRPQRPE